MARQLRIEYAGATYHLMARGNQGQQVFIDDFDRTVWLETLGEACEKTGWIVHAYVLMGNHFHLLVETPEGNLVTGMKWLQGTYTQRHNSRHALYGHLFQGRYKALVVDGEEGGYCGVVSTYIHLNPARAKLIRVGAEPLAKFRWSSYPAYLRSRRQRPVWLATDRVMGNVGLEPEDRSGYEAYLEARVLELGSKAGRKALEEDWKRIRRGWFLGADGFRGRLMRIVQTGLGKGRPASYVGPAKRDHGLAEAERLLALGMKALEVTARQLADGPRKMAAKRVLAWWLRRRTTVGRRWLSERLWLGDESAVSKASRSVKIGGGVEVDRLRRRLLDASDTGVGPAGLSGTATGVESAE